MRWLRGKRWDTCREPFGHAPPVLESSEHDLDAVSTFVAALIVSNCLLAGFPARDAGAYALVFQRISEPIGIIAPIRQHPVCLWEAAQQSSGSAVVADWSGCDEQADRAALRIGNGMQLCVHAAFGAADQPSEPPFFTRRPEAVRCALRQVASIIRSSERLPRKQARASSGQKNHGHSNAFRGCRGSSRNHTPS